RQILLAARRAHPNVLRPLRQPEPLRGIHRTVTAVASDSDAVAAAARRKALLRLRGGLDGDVGGLFAIARRDGQRLYGVDVSGRVRPGGGWGLFTRLQGQPALGRVLLRVGAVTAIFAATIGGLNWLGAERVVNRLVPEQENSQASEPDADQANGSQYNW